MPTATKRSATSKARTQTRKAADAEVGAREAGRARDAELAPKIAEARDKDMSWADIKAKFGVDQPKGQILIKMARLKPSERITFKSDTDLGRQAVKLRKAGVSWADIAVRAGVTIAHVKAAFAGTGADPGSSRVTKPATSKAKPAAKATAAKRAPAKGKVVKTRRRRSTAATDPSPQG